MALTSTLGSPGIEIREIDNSFRLDSSTTTTVYVPGFAAQGPVEEVMSISSISDFETIYGTPTNAAERYFYYTVKAILDGAGSGTTVLCSRLPYGSGLGDTVSNAYTLMAYPAIPVIKKVHKIARASQTGSYATAKDDETPDKKYDIIEDTFKLPQYIAARKIEKIGVINAEDNKVVTTNTFDALQLLTDTEIAHTFNIIVNNQGAAFVPSIKYSLFIDKDSDFEHDEISLSVSKSEDIIDSAFVADVGKTLGVLLGDSNNTNKLSMILQISQNGTKTAVATASGYLTREIIGDEFVIHFTSTVYDSQYTDKKIGAFTADFVFALSEIAALITEENKEDGVDVSNVSIKVSGNEGKSITMHKVESHEIAQTFEGKSTSQDGETNKTKFTDDVTYLIGSPATFHISLNDYYKIITGEGLKWEKTPYTFTQPTGADKSNVFGYLDAIGHSAFITINTSRSIINNNFEGYYVGLTDNMFVNPSDDYTYNAVDSVKITTKFYDNNENAAVGLLDNAMSLGDYQTLSPNRLSFYLDSNYQGSISRVLTRNITSLDISSTEYDDTISMGLFKLSKSATSSDILKLNYSIREKYNWSFGKTRVKSSAASTIPVSYFAENVMENSSNIGIMINQYIASKAFVDTEGRIHGKMRVYGKKLVDNLDNYEKKYLLRDFIAVSANNNSKAIEKLDCIVPVKVAESSMASWVSMVNQAGLTPEFIREKLCYDLTEYAEHDYATFQPLDSILPFGTYTAATDTSKIIGTLPAKLERALELVENDEEYPDIDIVLEAGLGTIYMNSADNTISSESASGTTLMTEDNNDGINPEDTNRSTVFDETIILQGVEDMRTGRTSISSDAEAVIEDYNAIQSVFTNFANSMQNGGRGDCFYISDVPRGILIKGKNTKVTNLFGTLIESNAYDFGDKVNHSFSTSVYYPIKHTFDSIVSSYMSTYAQWVKILDNFSGEKVWIPVSGYIAANMASTDAVYGPWYAAAGLRRGVINGVLDYALSPNVSQRTDLYKLCINSVPKIPNYGVTIWGIRTMSKADSAFDQNTCRRTFLYMEKKVKQTLRYYIFEPNTSYTRLQIVNDIDPFLEKVKNAGGIYNYTLTCDVTNNTPDVINNGDLAVSIAAAPTRTAENIVVEFTANKYTEEVSSSESIK